MNTINWLLWLALATAYSASTYNPAYQLALLAALSASATLRKEPLKAYLKMGALVSALPVAVNLLAVHMGATTLLTIPRRIEVLGVGVPTLILGGPLTLESAVFAASSALLVANMVIAFQTFTRNVPPESLLKVTPDKMAALGLTLAVALRFIPDVLRDHRSIRDAQASRGVRFDEGNVPERIRSSAAVITPTAITSLERGFALAESMAARGYGGARSAYGRQRWGMGEAWKAAALVTGIVLTAYAAYTGRLHYWPYESVDLRFSLMGAAPVLALLAPGAEGGSHTR